MMADNSSVTKIVHANLLIRFFATIIDVVFSLFVALGFFAISFQISKNVDSVKNYKNTYINLTNESGLTLYDYDSDDLNILTYETLEEYQTALYSFYNGFYSESVDDSVDRDIYWFNVHIYGQEDTKNLYSKENLGSESYLQKYGKKYFTYLLNESEEPEVDSFCLPIMYENNPDGWKNLDDTQKSELLSFFYKSDADRSKISEDSLWRNFALYYAIADLSSLPDIVNAYQMYTFCTTTIPILASITVAILIFFFVFPLCFKNGETLGKFIVGVGLVNKLGYQYARKQTIMRYGFTILFSAMIFVLFGVSILSLCILSIVFLASYLFSLFSKSHTAFHDLFAGTIVIDKKKSTWFKNADEEEKAQNEVNLIDTSVSEEIEK